MDIGLGLKFDKMYLIRKIDISMVTINRKKNKNTKSIKREFFMPIRFGVKPVDPSTYLKLQCTAHQGYKNKKKYVRLILNKSQIYLKP